MESDEVCVIMKKFKTCGKAAVLSGKDAFAGALSFMIIRQKLRLMRACLLGKQYTIFTADFKF